MTRRWKTDLIISDPTATVTTRAPKIGPLLCGQYYFINRVHLADQATESGQ